MPRLRALMLVLLALALAPAAADARLTRAETILPPGQSGFVSLAGVANGTGSPHLYDQLQPFIDFRWKAGALNQAGTAETPKPGVRIVRDSYGIPAITGATEQDMWWGAGYAAAEDRLFELQLFRRATTGRLSEVGGKERLDDDLIVRQDFYRPEELDRLFARLPLNLRQRFASYRDGINEYIRRAYANPVEELPAEFAVTGLVMEPWSIRDSVAVGVYLARTIPSNSDPEGLELANMRLAQTAGAKALKQLVPLRTKGALATIPRREGLFRSQRKLTKRQRRRALRRSLRLARSLPFPPAAERRTEANTTSSSATAARAGGSYMFAVRVPGRRAYLFNGPQLGFTAPERIMEQELHAPGFHLRGLTAPGAPVIGAGYNDKIAWGVSTGASDMDDLYAEELTAPGSERYIHRDRVRSMDCRTETIRYADPLSTLLDAQPPERGSVERRVCRTVHGPVEARAGRIAYARRHAIWGRELETLIGLDALNRASSIQDADHAVRKMTWNENIMAADSQGNIGFWHPGLFPVRPRRYDERLPYPGTGGAEWRRLRSRSKIPAVINPRQGWLANWNNVPSVGWTSGDGTARKRMDGPFFRVNLLNGLVRDLKRNPSFKGMQDVIRIAGTTPQQIGISRKRLRRARRRASGGALRVLDAVIGWNGSYHQTGSDGKVDEGVAAWDEFRKAAGAIGTAKFGPGRRWAAHENVLHGLFPGYHTAAPYHYFEATHLESYGLRTLRPSGYRRAAAAAYAVLVKRFGSGTPSAWREPRRMFDFEGLAAAQPPDLPFFDRGTYEQLVELGP